MGRARALVLHEAEVELQDVLDRGALGGWAGAGRRRERGEGVSQPPGQCGCGGAGLWWKAGAGAHLEDLLDLC